MQWDPRQYEQFADERARPFLDLFGRIGATSPRRVVDLGCGTGELTALLADRWPQATVEGIDSSPDMINAATPHERVALRVGEVESWTPPPDADVVISNAALHWVPSHRELLSEWAAALPPGGWLAVQVPGNFASFSHALLRSLAEGRRWGTSLTGIVPREDTVGTPEQYAGLLLAAGLTADAWETTYVHVLPGTDPVLEWLRGTALRPVMAALPQQSYALFEAEFAEQLRTAYPATERGTLFPFRRLFAVGHKPG